jgi:glycosyltransferase involved in cell wall biosynthesis
MWDHGRSVLSRRPYTYYEYQASAFSSQLSLALRRNPPDLVHLDSIDLYGYLRDLPKVPVACTHHDIDPVLLRLRAAQTPGLLGHYLRHQADLVERMVRDVCPQVQLNVMMSTLDAQRLRDLAPGSRTVVAPNGVDIEYFTPLLDSSALAGRIVFVGSTHKFANRDAVEFTLREILPRVRARHSEATLALIGRNSAADAARYAREPGVVSLGHVADVRPHVAQAACAVVPIRVGGGTRLKILDAWAMGKAVVATRIGCEGLNGINGENILMRDTPEAFAEAIAVLMADPAERVRLGANARETVENTYVWDLIGRELRGAYWDLLRDRVGNSASVSTPANRDRGTR